MKVVISDLYLIGVSEEAWVEASVEAVVLALEVMALPVVSVALVDEEEELLDQVV